MTEFPAQDMKIEVDDKQLGLVLRAMRVAANKTQSELARGMCISRDSIANMETGRGLVSLTTLVRAGEICEFEVKLVVSRKKEVAA